VSSSTSNGQKPVPVDLPQLRPLAKRPEHTQVLIIICMLLGIAGFIGFMVAYWVGNQNQWQAASLGGGMLFFGFGVTAWGKYLMPRGPFVEERHDFDSSTSARSEFNAVITQRGGLVAKRRGVLLGLLALGSGLVGLALAFPLLRSLGPNPSKDTSAGNTNDSLSNTNWVKGSTVVTVDNRRVKVDDLEVGGVLTVFPAGNAGSSPDQVILIRLDNAQAAQAAPGRADWGCQGIVAFSKLCTHLGCPVGLYQQQTQQLVCPCHQSIFNVNAGCVPEFGPAPRPLPQLPITATSDGYLVANGSFNQPVGPGFWERP
jgi:ubiquinol-cytochrome c reductase iron-sulfur subunit